MTVYADNAATTQMSDSVLKAMMPLLTDIYGNPSSLHSVGQIAKEHLEAARETVAECIGADPKEIYFTSGGSEADNQAIRSAAYIGARKGKKHIISSKFEHHAVLHTLDALKKEGFTVTLLDVYSNGIVKPEDVANAITEETCLVTIMTANNEIGTIQPIAEIGKICKEKGVLFHTDAVQAVGHIPVNVKDMNCDMLSVSAHKFHGPKGVGFLYARKGILLTNIIYGGAQERNKRAGTENVPYIVGLGKACELAQKSLDYEMTEVKRLRDKLENGILDSIYNAKVNGSTSNRVPNTTNIGFQYIEGELILLHLSNLGICASSGSACTSGSLEPSHVLKSMGVPFEALHGSIRFSLSRFTTDDEIEYTLKVLPDVIFKLNKISPYQRELKELAEKHK